MDIKTLMAVIIVGAIIAAGAYYLSQPREENKKTHTQEVVLEAHISADRTAVFVGQTVNFSAEGSVGEISMYYWDFGDGSTDTGMEVSHSYMKEGTYNVTLNVSDDQGHWDTDTIRIVVRQKGVSSGEEGAPMATLTCIGKTNIFGKTTYTITVASIDHTTARSNVTFSIIDNATLMPKYNGTLDNLTAISSPVRYMDLTSPGKLSQGDQIIVDEDLGDGIKAEPGDVFVLYYYDGTVIGYVQLIKI